MAMYPEKPVTLVIPYRAGGSTETMARVFSIALGSELGQKVIVKTSQTTKPWDTTEWLCDVEIIKNYAIKSSVGSKSLAADGKSNLSKTLAFTGQTSLIDYSLSQSEFKQEVDYEDFWKSLERQFESSWNAKNARIISEDTRRIRISGPNNLTKRNGFRVLVWNKLNVLGFEYYIVLKVDRKLDDDEFPNKKSIEKIKNEIDSVYEGGADSLTSAHTTASWTALG